MLGRRSSTSGSASVCSLEQLFGGLVDDLFDERRDRRLLHGSDPDAALSDPGPIGQLRARLSHPPMFFTIQFW